MKNAHAITVKYLPVTNTKGSRVKLYSHRFNDSVTLPYDYEYNSAYDIAANWLQTHGAIIICGAETRDAHVIMIDTFLSLKELSV